MEKQLAVFVSIALIVYVALRASFIPFTFDEVQTFGFYIQPGDMQPFYARMDANNHVLNSFLAHISFLMFGKSLLALRLPNVLALCVFLIYLLKFKRFFKTSYVWFLFFLTLVSCHFLIDFFNLCRGYGLSMAFMTGTAYHAILYSQKFSLRNLIATCLLLSASIWSNLSLLVFSISVLTLISLLSVKALALNFSVTRILCSIATITILLLVPLGYAIQYSLALQDLGVLYFGGTEGFWASTVTNLSYEISEGKSWGWPLFYGVFALYVVAIIAKRESTKQNFNSYIAHYLLWLTVLGTILLHLLLGVKYPLDRAALQFVILFLLSLFLLIDQRTRWLQSASSFIPVILMVHFASSSGFSHSIRWKTETVPAEFYEAMIDWQKFHNRPPTICAPIFQTTNLAFQDALKNSTLFLNLVPEVNSKYSDFIVYSNKLSQLDSIDFLLENYDTCLFEPNIPTVLFERHKANEEELAKSFPISPISSADLYIGLAELPLNPEKRYNAYRVDIEIEVQSFHTPLRWWLATRYDGIGEILGFDYSDLQFGASDIQNSKTIRVSHLIERQISDIHSLKIYIHNHQQRAIEIKRGQYSVTGLN